MGCSSMSVSAGHGSWRSRTAVAGSPVYDPDLTDRLDYFDEVYNYYGIGPFWGPGCRPPFG
jgi:hypothetical protein